MSFCFDDAKKLYEEISHICLKKSFEGKEKECFMVFDGVVRLCNDLLVRASSSVNKDEEEEDVEIRKLNKAIYEVYFNSFCKDGDYARDVGERGYFKEWKIGENPYDDLKKFAAQKFGEERLDYDKVVEIFEFVIGVLKEDFEIDVLEEKVNNRVLPYLKGWDDFGYVLSGV